MLRLKRLELQGFKSFCDRTELKFHGEGIAAVVGPNGCGKSNLADAIAWVLGEQSAKSLRGGSMQDVIFAGTRDRKPVGMAQVQLTLVDPDAPDTPPPAVTLRPAAVQNGHSNGHSNGHTNGHNGETWNGHAAEVPEEGDPSPAPSEDAGPDPVTQARTHHRPKEISVSRRLYRSGESEYRLNGKVARLRDIQDLFMGTGLGPESYAIIEQGRIGQILSSRPYDRRAIIEEAAGVTKFKSRRKLAEAKLESAKQNLTRVFDILCEVERQMNSLKRQAAKAKRYVELRDEYVGYLKTVLAARYQVLEREAAKIALDLNAATQSLDQLQSRLGARELEQQMLQQERYQKEVALTEARKRLADLRLETERTRGRLASQASQAAGIEQRLVQGDSESRQLEARLTQLTTDLEAHSENLERLNQEFAEAQGRLAAKNAERESLQSSVRERERVMESARQQVLRLMGESSALRNQLAQIASYLESVDREKARAQREEAGASEELAGLSRARTEIAEKIAERKREQDDLVQNRRVVEQELNEHRNQVRTLRHQSDQLRSEFSTLKARQQSLEEILSHHAYTTQTVKKLFTSVERGQSAGLRPKGVLADFLELEPGHEKAVEEFLHEELEYVVVENWQDAWKGIDLVRSDGNGRATFCLQDGGLIGSHGAAGAQQEPAPAIAGATRLLDVLRPTGGLSKGALAWAEKVARCYLVEHRETAERLAGQHPHLWFLLPDGVAYHGPSVSGGRKSGSGPLALKRELRDLNVKVNQREQSLTETREKLEAAEQQILQFTEELEQIRARQQAGEKEGVALDAEARKLQSEASRAESRLNVARLDLKRLDQEVERSSQRRGENEKAAEIKEQAKAEQERLLESARLELDGLSEAFQRIGEEHSTLRVDLAGLEERRRAELSARTRVENQFREVENRRRHLAEEVTRLQAERMRLIESNVELQDRVGLLEQETVETDQQVKELAAVEEQMRTALAEMDQSLKGERIRVQESMTRKSDTEVQLIRCQSEIRILEETSRKELSVPVSELIADGEEFILDETQLEELREKCDKLRQRIDSLGPVNPDAMNEFDEVQDRYEFLSAQRQDLLDSIRDTEKAIHDIDVESRRKFQAAFEAINANFRETFKTLFGGGMGEMRLTDETNLAESGIDIVGSPPGKRLQNILLLSGGEKALTAMALLMAIFQYRPSPFCVLDEVDAPLDEPNIMRFTRLVKEMSIETQFVIITHAKRTMESAQILYGVTMQEPGVSSVVGVRFDPVGTRPELTFAGVGR